MTVRSRSWIVAGDAHRPIAWLALLQANLIVLGTLSTAAMVKVWTPMSEQGLARINPVSLWVREQGFWLLAIPLLWGGWSLWLQRPGSKAPGILRPSVTGLLLLFALLGFFAWAALLAVAFRVHVAAG